MNPLRNTQSTARPLEREMMPPESTPLEPGFRLFRLCPCEACNGMGWVYAIERKRCKECRGEGRVLQLVATAATPEAVGTALVTLAQEGEFEDCPLGLLDLGAESGSRWLIRPWQASPRNVSDAGKLLRSSQTKGTR